MIDPLLLVPALSLALLVLGTVALSRKVGRPRASALAWAAVPALTLTWLAAWVGLGLYDGRPTELVLLCAATLASAACALAGERVRRLVSEMSPRGRGAIAIATLLACSALTFLAMELPYSNDQHVVMPHFALLECALILGASLALYFLLQRSAVGVALVSTACALVGVAQFFVASFKGSAILPTDLLVLGTAAAVSGGYVYSVIGPVLLGLACWLLSVGLCSLVPPLPAKALPDGRRACARNVAVGLACAVAVALGVALPAYEDGLGVHISYWNSLWSYRTQGFLPTFIAVAQDLAIDEPAGYSDEVARRLESDYAAAYDQTRGTSDERAAAEKQFNELQPSVIYVVNEAFADLNCLGGEDWGYAGPVRYNSRDDALMRGDLSVSITGGGTCNSEFELLTGVSLAYVGEGKYPFSLYDLSQGPSVARQFAELGYDTTAMHPNKPNNYNRIAAYDGLGFDTYLSMQDFNGDDWFHSGISDEATYDKVLEILRSDDDPQFILDLTMQNHSGYTQHNIDTEPYTIEGLGEDESGELSEYLACIEESDRAFENFLEELEALDRPVVLVFIGDHQPYCAPAVNDALHPGESGYDHEIRLYETTYTVWANYDVAGQAQVSAERTLGLSHLSALTLDAIGAPLTNFQKAQIVTSETLPTICLMGVRGTDDSWVPTEEAATVSTVYEDLQAITYLEFARAVS